MIKKKLMLIWFTVNYLRWSQIWFRLYYRFVTLRVAPTGEIKVRKWTERWSSPAKNLARSVLNLSKVIFLGEPGEIVKVTDWNNSQKSKIWLYNLHYLDELSSIHANEQIELLTKFIEKWIGENPPCQGNGWEPYPLSLRLVNLVKWYANYQLAISEMELISLGLQAQALLKQVEYHIRGNHLFANGKALVFVGAFFSGAQANCWLKKGLDILDIEIKEQFLKDGAHFELSPMYHASLLWDLCDLFNLAQRTGVPELIARKNQWQLYIEEGMRWLQLMCHPDGNISFFNDAAFGIAPTLSEIQNYIEELGLGFSTENNPEFSFNWLKESGYGVVHFDAQSKAILDIGKIGPDYQPGHAHADTLSFELSLHGQRVLVNSGTSQYGENATRQLQRGTKAHNTVSIDNEDSSEVWAGFRVARRAYPQDLMIHEDAQQIKVGCTHNGYRRLAGRNLHRREWTLSKYGLSILDSITGQYATAEARFYFHPDILVEKLHDDTVRLKLLNGKESVVRVKRAENICIEAATWHPFFGVSIKNFCLVALFKENTLLTEIEWGV